MKILKKIFDLYNLAILGCIILIVTSLIFIIEPDFSNILNKKDEIAENNSIDEIKIVQYKNKGREISEEEARDLAKKQFKVVGEKNINADELEVLRIDRQGEKYYYISSNENTLEIRIKTGEITRVNSVKVNK